MWEAIYEWTAEGWRDVPLVILSGVVIYVAIIAYVRLSGLRSFSKMSAADFAMTVAVGSLFASSISSPDPSLTVGLVALAVLFAGQVFVAFLRKRAPLFRQAVDNNPLLLMAGPEIIDENLRRAHVTRKDLYGKLREANVLNFDQVFAVVFECTGDISVLHSDDQDVALEPEFFQGVRDSDRLFQ